MAYILFPLEYFVQEKHLKTIYVVFINSTLFLVLRSILQCECTTFY